ncbi:MAG: DUF4287 domain-containing protein [Flavobacteriales bacterium]|nr:DUF4287 domain-containing protein [Flavobacteriales bacterium]
MIQNLEELTGKNFDELIQMAKNSGFAKHGEMVKWLKETLDIGHGYANLVAMKAREADAASVAEQVDLVSEQYKDRPELKPIYDALMKRIEGFGSEVEVAPKVKSVSVRRKRQFALIQATTKTRVDLGLKFNNRPIEGRLEASGPFGAMCTHRVQLTDAKQVDDELIGLIKEAFNEAK